MILQSLFPSLQIHRLRDDERDGVRDDDSHIRALRDGIRTRGRDDARDDTRIRGRDDARGDIRTRGRYDARDDIHIRDRGDVRDGGHDRDVNKSFSILQRDFPGLRKGWLFFL